MDPSTGAPPTPASVKAVTERLRVAGAPIVAEEALHAPATAPSLIAALLGALASAECDAEMATRVLLALVLIDSTPEVGSCIVAANGIPVIVRVVATHIATMAVLSPAFRVLWLVARAGDEAQARLAANGAVILMVVALQIHHRGMPGASAMVHAVGALRALCCNVSARIIAYAAGGIRVLGEIVSSHRAHEAVLEHALCGLRSLVLPPTPLTLAALTPHLAAILDVLVMYANKPALVEPALGVLHNVTTDAAFRSALMAVKTPAHHLRTPPRLALPEPLPDVASIAAGAGAGAGAGKSAKATKAAAGKLVAAKAAPAKPTPPPATTTVIITADAGPPMPAPSPVPTPLEEEEHYAKVAGSLGTVLSAATITPERAAELMLESAEFAGTDLTLIVERSADIPDGSVEMMVVDAADLEPHLAEALAQAQAKDPTAITAAPEVDLGPAPQAWHGGCPFVVCAVADAIHASIASPRLCAHGLLVLWNLCESTERITQLGPLRLVPLVFSVVQRYCRRNEENVVGIALAFLRCLANDDATWIHLCQNTTGVMVLVDMALRGDRPGMTADLAMHAIALARTFAACAPALCDITTECGRQLAIRLETVTKAAEELREAAEAAGDAAAPISTETALTHARAEVELGEFADRYQRALRIGAGMITLGNSLGLTLRRSGSFPLSIPTAGENLCATIARVMLRPEFAADKVLQSLGAAAIGQLFSNSPRDLELTSGDLISGIDWTEPLALEALLTSIRGTADPRVAECACWALTFAAASPTAPSEMKRLKALDALLPLLHADPVEEGVIPHVCRTLRVTARFSPELRDDMLAMGIEAKLHAIQRAVGGGRGADSPEGSTREAVASLLQALHKVGGGPGRRRDGGGRS